MAKPADRRGARLIALGVSAALAVGLVGGCSDDSAPVASQGPSGTGARTAGGTLRLGVSKPDPAVSGSGLDTLDPAEVFPTNQAEMIAIDLLFESLTTIDPATNRAGPALARSFVPNADLTVWTFSLRDGAVFSDGSPITAADAKFSLERVARKGTTSIAGAALAVIAGYPEFLSDQAASLSGVVALDDRTVQISTTGPSAGLPELLASPTFGIVPKAAAEAMKSGFGDKPVGSGSFAWVSDENDVMILARAKGATTIVDGVEMVRYGTKVDAMRALQDGRVDWAAVTTGGSLSDAARIGTVMPGVHSSERFFGFNLGTPVYGANADFRRAIVRAIDRKRIATEILDSNEPMNGVVPPSLSKGYVEPCAEPCSHDIAAAKALLVAAFPSGVIPGVRIDYYSGATEEDQVQQKVAEAMQADLKAVGIQAELAPKSFEEYQSFAVSADRQLFSYGWVGLAPDPDAYVSPLFRSGSPDNVTGFNDPEIDGLLATARATADRAARDKLYGDIEQKVMATAPLVPLADLDSSVVVGSRVRDYTPRFDGTFVAEKVRVLG